MDPARDSAFEIDLYLSKEEAVAVTLAGEGSNPLYCTECINEENRARRKD